MSAKKGVNMLRVGGSGLREGSKRDSSTAQADSFADEREEKASACSDRNDRLAVAELARFGLRN